METSVAKRPRLEPQNAEEIIREQRRIIESQKTVIERQKMRIIESQKTVIENQKIVIENQEAEIEQLVQEQRKNLELSATEIKTKNVSVAKLPKEIWLEIMSYLSTKDVLRNVAQVSKWFHKLSKDPHVIRKIEVDPSRFWPKDKEEKYCDDFLGVLKRSVKLRSLSFGFSGDIEITIDKEDEIDEKIDKSGEKFLEALPFMNHPFLQEVCLKGDGKVCHSLAPKFLEPMNENLLRYLEKCPELKVLKFEFKPQVHEDRNIDYPLLSEEFEESIRSLKLKNLQEFHLIGVDLEESNLDPRGELIIFLEEIAENLPKLKRLCFTCQDIRCVEDLKNNKRFGALVSGKNIMLEFSSVFRNAGPCNCAQSWDHPIKKMLGFGPKNLRNSFRNFEKYLPLVERNSTMSM